MTRRELRGRGARAGGSAGSGRAAGRGEIEADDLDADDLDLELGEGDAPELETTDLDPVADSHDDDSHDDDSHDDDSHDDDSHDDDSHDDDSHDDDNDLERVGEQAAGVEGTADADADVAHDDADADADVAHDDATRRTTDEAVGEAGGRTWPHGLAFPPTRSWEGAASSPFPPVGAPTRRTSAWSFEPPLSSASDEDGPVRDDWQPTGDDVTAPAEPQPTTDDVAPTTDDAAPTGDEASPTEGRHATVQSDPSGSPAQDTFAGGDHTAILPPTGRRAAAAARDEAARDEGARDEGARDEGARDEGARDEGARDEGARDEAAPADPSGPGAWDLAVGWSLRHELPRELPPEPDVEDVYWDTMETTPLALDPKTHDQDAPVEESVDGPPDEQDNPVRRTTGPVSRPVAEYADVTATTEIDLAELEHADETGSEAEDQVAPNATAAPSDEAAGARSEADQPHGRRPALPHGTFTPMVAPTSPEPGARGELPTLQDLLAARPVAPAGPAETGWQGTVRRLTGGLVAPAPGRAEQVHRSAVAVVQRSLAGPKTVVVINPKGGAHKTTATLLLAATFGQHRGGYTLAWDNNETRGTLGWRSHQSRHHNTAVNLLQDLERFSDPRAARVGDLDNYVRSQGSGQFDVLASDEDAASAASIDAFAFRSLHRTLSRFYRIMVIDTGNNMRASNWQAAIEAADQVVLVSTVREDTAQSAAWAVDALRATGHEEKVRQAITVLSAPAERRDDRLAARLHEHFGRLTRQVLDVPYDPSLVAGKPLDVGALSDRTREAWLTVTAAVAEGL